MTKQTLWSRYRNRPIRTAAVIFAFLVAAHVAGEFGSGVIDGFVSELTNGV